MCNGTKMAAVVKVKNKKMVVLQCQYINVITPKKLEKLKTVKKPNLQLLDHTRWNGHPTQTEMYSYSCFSYLYKEEMKNGCFNLYTLSDIQLINLYS